MLWDYPLPGVPCEPPIHPRGARVPQYSRNVSIYTQDNPYPPLQPELAPYFFYVPPGHPWAPLEPQHAP